MINKKYFFFVIILLPILFIFSLNYLKIYLTHDSLLHFEVFKYLLDTIKTHKFIPTWIDASYGGIRLTSYFLTQPVEIAGIFFVIGYFFNIESYYIYLLFLSLLISINLYGYFKLLFTFFKQNAGQIFIIIIFINLLGINIFREYLVSQLIHILIPYYIYYFLKFIKNKKIQEIFKVINLFLIKFYISFHYFMIIEGYLIIILIFFSLYKTKILIKKKFTKYLCFPFFLIYLNFTNYNLYNSFNFFHYNRSETGVIEFKNFISENIQVQYYKIHTFFSNFLWSEQNLIISSLGLICVIFFLKKRLFNKNIILKVMFIISLILISISLLGLGPLEIKKFTYKILYQLPFFKYQYHIFYWHLFSKTFILIFIIYSLNEILVNFNENLNNIIKCFKIYFILIFSYLIFFILNTEKYNDDKNIFISLLLTLFPIVFIYIILIFKKKLILKNSKKIILKKNIIFLFFLISILPHSIFNFSKYSFYNFKFLENYKNIYFSNKYSKKYNFECKEEEVVYKEIPSAKIKDYIIDGSTDYNHNILNNNIFSCNKIFALGLVETNKRFSRKPKHFLYDDYKEFKYINNQHYIFKIPEPYNFIKTNISYSIFWNVLDENKNKLSIKNFKGFLMIENNGSKKFNVYYNNINEKINIIFRIFFGILIIVYFFINLTNFINKKINEEK